MTEEYSARAKQSRNTDIGGQCDAMFAEGAIRSRERRARGCAPARRRTYRAVQFYKNFGRQIVAVRFKKKALYASD